MSTKKTIYKCAECGSTDIEFRRWYNPNTGELGVDCEDEECWCKHCEEHRPVDCVEVDEPEPDNALLATIRTEMVQMLCGMTDSDIEKMADAIQDKVAEDVRETSDYPNYNDSDIRIAIARTLKKKLGVEE